MRYQAYPAVPARGRLQDDMLAEHPELIGRQAWDNLSRKRTEAGDPGWKSLFACVPGGGPEV